MMMRLFSVAVAVLAVAYGQKADGAIMTFGPTPYLSAADSPFDLGQPSFFLEDFEDGLLNTPGVSAINGQVRGPSGLTDSVDADDGVIDGDGHLGHSYLVRPGVLGVTFVFDDQVLGGFPTFVGIVSTDGYVNLPANTVEFFDASGALVATLDDPVQNPNINTTDDDRFLGVFNPGGISKITITNLGTGNAGMEVDHLQYGSESQVPIDIEIDIRDSINLKSKGVLSVAVASTTDFDVTIVDIDTLLFGDPLRIANGALPVSPIRSALDDVTGDGLLDLSLKFRIPEMVEAGVLGPDSTELVLTGSTLDGMDFLGSDTFRIVSVPEPNSLLLLGIGLLFLRRRRLSR